MKWDFWFLCCSLHLHVFFGGSKQNMQGEWKGLTKLTPCICNEACIFQTGKQGLIQYVSPFSNIGIWSGREENVQWLQQGLGIYCYVLAKRGYVFLLCWLVCLSVCLLVSNISLQSYKKDCNQTLWRGPRWYNEELGLVDILISQFFKFQGDGVHFQTTYVRTKYYEFSFFFA